MPAGRLRMLLLRARQLKRKFIDTSLVMDFTTADWGDWSGFLVLCLIKNQPTVAFLRRQGAPYSGTLRTLYFNAPAGTAFSSINVRNSHRGTGATSIDTFRRKSSPSYQGQQNQNPAQVIQEGFESVLELDLDNPLNSENNTTGCLVGGGGLWLLKNDTTLHNGARRNIFLLPIMSVAENVWHNRRLGRGGRCRGSHLHE